MTEILALGDREAERVVGAVQEEDDQEADQGRLPPLPPDPPLGAGPDRPGDEHRDAEDHRHVDRHVGAGVVDGVAASQMADRVDPGDDETDQGDDGERHVQVEDLLDEALAVERRVEKGKREAGAEDEGAHEGECAKAIGAHVGRARRRPVQSSSR